LKALFDTNLLIAAAFLNHEWNSLAAKQLERVFDKTIVGCVSAHSIAEFYAVATRYPKTPMPALIAQEFLDDTLKHFEIIEFGASDYNSVIARVSNLNLVGGAIFDALIAQAALKAKADQLLTFNAKHFSRLGEDVAGIVVTPS
jgi:predicted nucleic acid-binding protein